MIEHLFLTGQPHVGKSTLLNRCLAEKDCRIGGFRTVWSDCTHTTLHLLSFTGSTCCAENCIAERVGEALIPRSGVFDRLGPVLLREPCDLLIMDELGFLENDALLFQSAVLSALDGDLPVLGVIKPQHTPFLDAVRTHARVHIIEVNEKNRDVLKLP